MNKFITLTLTEGFEPIRLNTNDIHKYRKHLTDDGTDKTRIELNTFKPEKYNKREREAIIVDMSVSHVDELMDGLWSTQL